MIRPLKAVITSNGLLNVSNHMKEVLGHDIKIENVKYFIRCINKNPITAFGYDLMGKDSKLYNHPHFSKHDMIRALDFWIEHWVYQNQLEATFTDTVNVDHEITLKELILVREKIMKMPADTKFTRERIKEPVTSAGQIRKQKEKVVFTQAVYCEDSSLDPFCHMVLELTPEEYIKYKNKPYATGQINFSEEFLINATNTAGAAFTNITAALTANIQGSMEDLAAALSRTAPITVSAPWTVILPEFEVMSVPAEARSFTIDDTTVEDDEVHTGPDHLLHSNLHPGIHDDTITYVNMRSVVNGQPVMEDPNTFVIIPVSFSGNGAEINADVFLQSGDMIDELTSWNNHRIQIRPGQRNFLEIDGEEYHCASMRLSHNPSTPLTGMIFRDLIKISTETTGGRIVSMEVNFGAHIGITQCEIYLKIDNPDGGRLMDDRSFTQWDLEILGNNRVRIGDHDYTVTEPIEISMR